MLGVASVTAQQADIGTPYQGHEGGRERGSERGREGGGREGGKEGGREKSSIELKSQQPGRGTNGTGMGPLPSPRTAMLQIEQRRAKHFDCGQDGPLT